MKTEPTGRPPKFKIGDAVNIDAHGERRENFAGIVHSTDPLFHTLKVRAPDGEVYQCDERFAWHRRP